MSRACPGQFQEICRGILRVLTPIRPLGHPRTYPDRRASQGLVRTKCAALTQHVKKKRFQEISWTFPGNVEEMSRRQSGTFPRNVREISWIFLGNFQGMSGTVPGNVLDMSGKFPAHIRDIFGLFRICPRNYHEISRTCLGKFHEIARTAYFCLF